MRSARVVWLGFVVAVGGCARLDLSDAALLRCTTNEACPAAWRCAASIERCVPEGGEDLVGPQLVSSTLQVNDAPYVDGTIVGASVTAVWHFTVDEPLFTLPTAMLVSDLDVPSLPMAVLADDDGAGYSMVLRVSSDAGTAVLTPVVALVDRVGNRALVELSSLPIDTVAPVATAITLTPADFAIDETVAVAIDARDDHATTACIKAVDDDDTDINTIAATCGPADFGALARTVTLPAGNGEKRVVAVVNDESGNSSAAVEARVVRLEGGVVDSSVTLIVPPGQREVKPGDTVDVAVVLTAGAEPTITRLLVDGVARDIVVAFASVASDRVEGSFVVPADVADRSNLVLQVTASYLGRSSDDDQSRSNALVVDAVAPTIDLAASTLAVSARTVTLEVRQLRPDTIQHFLVEGDLDSGSGTVAFTPAITVVLAETAESDDLDAIKVRDVRVRAVDGAGNVSAEDTLRFRLLPDAALGALELRNGERQLVAGLKTRTRDPVAFGGTVEDSAAVLVAGSAQLVYLDDDGAVVCTQPVPTLGLEQGVFVGSTRTTVCAEGPAASVHLEAQIAFAGGLPTVLSSADLFIDNDVPTVTSLVFVPVGDQRNNTTNSTSVQVSLQASDVHNATVAFSGDVVDDGVVSIASPIDGQRTFDLTLVSLNGGAQATRTVIAELEDDVGNRTLRVLNLVVDTVPPAPPRVVEARVVERAITATDPLQTTAPNAVELVVQPPVIDSADRLLVLVDDDAVAVDPVEIRGPNNVFILPAGTGRVSLVSVDDAGNRSSGNPTIDVPRLVVGALPDRPLGPTPTTFTITSSVSAGVLGVSLPAALAVHVGEARASCLPNPLAADTEVQCSIVLAAGQAPEGRVGDGGAAIVRVDLTAPRVVATSGTPVIVDTTPPVLSTDLAILDVVSVGRGAVDLVVGDVDAVVDFAGDTRLGDVFAPRVVVTSGAAREEATAAADGSFTVDVGDFGDDLGSADVVVTATDAAGNVGVPVTLFNDVRRPSVAVTLSASRFRGGDTIGVDVAVTDASAVLAPLVTIGGAAATVSSVSASSFSAEFEVAFPVVDGARSVVVDVVDVAGNTQRVTRSVTVDGVAPAITPQIATRTNQTRLEADVVDASGSVARVDVVVRDTADNATVFSGALARASGNRFFVVASGLLDGHTYVATLSAVDDVGNSSSIASPFVFDTSPPVVQLTVDTSDPYQTRVPFSVNITGDVDLSTLECRVDSTRSDRFTSCDNATFGISSGVLTVAPGQHLLAVRARDAAGNQSVSDEETFTVRARRLLAGGGGVWCAIDDDDHTMQCWGNQHGELDAAGVVGPVGPRSIPPIGALQQRSWRKVAVHKGTICALDTNFTLLCWGDNTNARALRPVVGDPAAPVSLTDGLAQPGPGVFVDVALFDDGGCAIDSDRQLQCWGKSLFNTFQPPQPTPQVVSFERFDTVVGAGRVVCAASVSGDGMCFGDSADGKLLTGAAAGGFLDAAIAGDVGDISTSGGHSCVVRRSDRTVQCAGDDSSGAVTGNRNFGPPPGPQLQPSQLGVALKVVAAGDRTCALGVDGLVRCQGQLAHGEVAGGGRFVQPVLGVLPVLDGAYDDVTADEGTVCGIERGTDRVLCVGDNGGGQIDLEGIASADDFAGDALPSSVRRLTMVGHTVCASLNDGRRFCMGDSPRNRWIVDNPFQRFTSDVLMQASESTGENDIFAMADDYACAARRSSFSAGIVCVGDVGAPLARPASVFDATETFTVTALQSPGVRAIALTDTFGCAASDNDISCWGQLPTTRQLSVQPVVVSIGGTFGQVEEIAAGDEHLCQRTTSGVQCLGSNSTSQLGSAGGSATTLRAITTTQGVSFGEGFSSSPRRIAARGDNTCVTTSSGPGCWGSNVGGIAGASAGFFGGPTFANVPVPRMVDDWDVQTGNCAAEDVDVGRDVACATCGNRGIFCWGGRDPIDNDPDFLRQVDDGFGYSEVAVSDEGVVCAVQFNDRVRCFGDLTFGLSGTGNGFRETATHVVLP